MPACGVVLFVTAAFAPAARALTYGSPHLVPGTYQLNAVVCPTASQCLGVGTTGNPGGDDGVGVVVPISPDGVPGTPSDVPGTNGLASIACASATSCVAVGSYESPYPGEGVVVPVSASGIPGSVEPVTQAEWLTDVACDGSAGCVGVGDPSPGSGADGVIVHTSVGGTVDGSHSVSQGTDEGVACASATLCDVLAESGSTWGVLHVAPDGVPGSFAPVTGGFPQGIACASTGCVAVGPTNPEDVQDAGYAVPITTDGTPGTAHDSGPTDYDLPVAVACPSSAGCLTAMGNGMMPVSLGGVYGAYHSAQSVSGDPQLFGVACPSTARCLLVGADFGDQRTDTTGEIVPVDFSSGSSPGGGGTPTLNPAGNCAKGTGDVTVGMEQVIGCLARTTKADSYTSSQRFDLNGLEFIPRGKTTLTLKLGASSATISANGSSCIGALITLSHRATAQQTFTCSSKASTVRLSKSAANLSGIGADAFGTMADLPLASVAVSLESGYRTHVKATLVPLGIISPILTPGTFTSDLSNTSGLAESSMCLSMRAFGQLTLAGVIQVSQLGLCFDQARQELDGTFQIYMPNPVGSEDCVTDEEEDTPATITVKGVVGFHAGSLPAVGEIQLSPTFRVSLAVLELGASGLNVEIPDSPYLYLQQISGLVRLDPHLQLGGQMGISLGCEVSLPAHQNVALMLATGALSGTFGGDDGWSDFFYGSNPDDYYSNAGGDYDTFNIDGKIYLFATNSHDLITVASSHFTLVTGARAHFHGYIHAGGFLALPSLYATINGSTQGPKSFSVVGTASWSELGANIADGEFAASGAGVEGCAQASELGSSILSGISPGLGLLAGVDFGFIVHQPGSIVPSFFTGCTFSDVVSGSVSKGSPRRHAASASSPLTLRVPAGRRAEAIVLRGTDAPPNVTITGPGDRRMITPSQRDHLYVEDGAVALADTSDDTTTFEIGRPAAGTWTITPAAGSSPIASLGTAAPLPTDRVHARVTRRSATAATLSWRFDRARGRSVEFVDTGSHASRVLLTTSKPHGRLRFDPLTSGSPGRRHIEAIVEQDGVTRSESNVAAYTAEQPSRSRAVTRLRVTRRGDEVTIRWRRVAGARGYLLALHLAHRGGSGQLTVSGHRHAATIWTPYAGRVAVSAAQPGRRLSKARTASWKAPSSHRRTRKRRGKHHKH